MDQKKPDLLARTYTLNRLKTFLIQDPCPVSTYASNKAISSQSQNLHIKLGRIFRDKCMCFL